ncbi:MAG: hypothetical protein Q9187_000004 [Circinaria calcarea]
MLPRQTPHPLSALTTSTRSQSSDTSKTPRNRPSLSPRPRLSIHADLARENTGSKLSGSEFEGGRSPGSFPDASQDRGLTENANSRAPSTKVQDLRRQMSALSAKRVSAGATVLDQSDGFKASSMDGFSPIREETVSPRNDGSGISPLPSGAQTVSTESNRTIKGSGLPRTPGALPPLTPSYPFPSMATMSGTPLGTPSFHKPFTALSPTVEPPSAKRFKGQISRDFVASGHLAPYMLPFAPQGDSRAGNFAMDTKPNIYDIMLRLTSEPGLEYWWTQLTQVLKEGFEAERITLAVPSDSTDMENVPWAQMATYNSQEEDPLSKVVNERMSTHSSLIEANSQNGANGENNGERQSNPVQARSVTPVGKVISASRPGLESRHSFAGYPQTARNGNSEGCHKPTDTIRRPPTTRTGSHSSLRGGRPAAEAIHRNVELSAESLRRHEVTEALKSPMNDDVYAPSQPTSGRVLNVVQPLESEADPLLTTAGVIKLLDRTDTVLLTREYVDESQSIEQRMAEGRNKNHVSRRNWTTLEEQVSSSTRQGEKTSKGPTGDFRPINLPRSPTSGSSHSSSTSRTTIEAARPKPSGDIAYEDYEQVPASPWSQSPAPSPAVQADPDSNPFFVDATVDENAFAEDPPAHDYTAEYTIPAIGIDRANSVLHIPLVHPTMSHLKHPPRLDTIKQKGKYISSKDKHPFRSLAPSESGKRLPIAILSMLSPVVPYPAELTSSLNLLIPLLATSFYNARHHSNLQNEINGLSRQRQGHRTRPGYPSPRQVARSSGLAFIENNENGFSPPTSGSFSTEYSGISIHSPRDSFGGGSVPVTPSWINQDGRSQSGEYSGNSPNISSESPLSTSDSYFLMKPQHDTGRSRQSPTYVEPEQHNPYFRRPIPPGDSTLTVIQGSQVEVERSRANRHSGAGKTNTTESSSKGNLEGDPNLKSDNVTQPRRNLSGLFAPGYPDQSATEGSVAADKISSRKGTEQSRSPRRPAMQHALTHAAQTAERKHRQIHSHGADFSATNPSLPHATTIISPPKQQPGEPRPPQEVNYIFKDPTPAMLRLMIDNGSTQQFIAECVKGAIVWANSRFQSYRSQSAEEIHRDPWNNMHYKDQKSFRRLWKKALETGEQVSHQVRLRRFDGQYRWFHMRILPLKDKHAVIKHWHGQAMDIHEQHCAEVQAARQKEKAASESKYRSLANSNPHIIFAASVPTGMTFANTQWLSYSGQSLEETLGFGFLQHVHPDDLYKCRFPDIGKHTDPKSISGLLFPNEPITREPSPSIVTDESEESIITDRTMKPHRPGGSSVVEAPSDLLRDLVKQGVIKCSKDGQGNLSITTEMRLRSKSNEYRWHLVQGSLIESVNFGQGDAQWIIACADISDQKRIEDQLKQACGTVEKEMSRKMEYLSSMSHEIRTPLNGILGNLQFLTNSGLDEFQSDWAFAATKAADGMHKILNDILDLSKAEAKMLKLFYDWFSVRGVIEEVVETLNAKAGQKGLELCYEVAEAVPSSVKGDGGRIKQVLLNLVGNAIKFTQQGEIWIQCNIMDEPSFLHPGKRKLEPNEIYLQFCVKDTGSGFSEEERKLLFKPYSQIDNSNTRSNGGTGLGLILSMNMVQLHGGQIDATSVPGQGSTFTFYARFSIRESTVESISSYSSVLQEPFLLSPRRLMQGEFLPGHLTESPGPSVGPPGSALGSPAVNSSASSDPSIGSLSFRPSVRSSTSTMADEVELRSLNLKLPPQIGELSKGSLEPNSPVKFGIGKAGGAATSGVNNAKAIISIEPESFRPPLMLSILIVCPQENTRRTTQEHIQRVLPKSVPAKVTAQGNVEASRKMITGDDPITFTHVVLQLSAATEVLAFMDEILNSISHPHTCIVVVTDQAQKTAITNAAPNYDYKQLCEDGRLRFLMKPARPHKFAKIFDPDQENAQSNDDRTREEAREKQRLQKAAFKLFKEALGNKGIRVLAVEDNHLNMDMLTHFLSNVCCLEVTKVWDGQQAVDAVFQHEPLYYSVIVCDIEMPIKDGYTACREIRRWEVAKGHPHVPMISLSANVMTKGWRESAQAGFTQYAAKPVEWRVLGNLILELVTPGGPHIFLRDRPLPEELEEKE